MVSQDNTYCFDYSAKHLIAFSDELAKTRMHNRRWKRELSLCETRWSSRADAVYTFRIAFSVVVSSLETLKNGHDEKVTLYFNAILKFDFIIALVVAEHILSPTVALTNYLQKCDTSTIK